MNQYLHKLIEEGEHQQQDFKYCINDSKKIAKSLVAFANTDGGRLLIGVKDNGKIVGISTDEEFYMVEAAAKIYSNPPVNFLTKQYHSEGKTVLRITVEPSTEKPHYAKDESGKWLAYIRKNDENILAHKIQLVVWNKQKSPQGICFTYSDDEKFLIQYLQENERITFSKFMRLAQISRQKAQEILSNFIIMDIIRLNTTLDGTYFYLNTDFDKTELVKFE
ncbi:MAG: RNA-binding domain-containing protein [Bacteroidota bacterium]